MKTTNFITKGLLLTSLCILIGSCMKNDNLTIMLGSGINRTNIPNDSMATPNPSLPNTNTTIPNINYTIEDENGQKVVRIDMTGIHDSSKDEWLRLIGTGGSSNQGQNIWLSLDDQPKGIYVHNTIDDVNSNAKAMNDFIFLVDNSGSMADEANAIARDIIDWAKRLNQTLDVRFGCVGYDGEITGAINMTTYDNIAEYLNKYSGTNRTSHFGGNDSAYLNSKADNYFVSSISDECGMAALHFANDLFDFRNGANRIYVNFTDEYNYNDGESKYSVYYLSSQYNWDTTSGTIHTVYSSLSTSTSETTYYEKPWRMSEFTGGSILYTSDSFSNVSLDDLPVTSAMKNSYIIKFTNIEQYMDNQYHNVKITIKSTDGKVRAEKIFNMKFSN